MTKDNAKTYRDACIASLRRKGFTEDNINALHMPKYCPINEATANRLTQLIMNFLKWHQHQAERINTMGRMVNGRYIPTTGTKGSADISATIHGRSVKIEVKVGRDRQSEHQKKYQQDIERAGGVYIIANNFDQFMQWYEQFNANNSN